MNKLIAVGMRYQSIGAVKEAIDTYKRSKRLVVQLGIEDNSSGVNGKAVAVFHKGKRVAFIRNKDLEILLQNKYDLGDTWEVSGIWDNYWVIIKTNCKVENPCNEVSANTSATCSIKFTEQINTQKEPKMNVSNMRDSFFREMKNVAIDFQSGKMGVTSAEGLSVYVDGGVSVNPITDFGIKIPAFAMRTAVADLKEGDIVVNGNDFSFFKALTENGYEVVSLNGEVKQVGNVANLFFGKNSVLAVKNMFNGSGMNPMMMAMMLGDGKEFDMRTFAMMSMMGGGQMDSNMGMMMALAMSK
jgi:hypothetical protein